MTEGKKFRFKGVQAYYDSIIRAHGPVPEGVGWNSSTSQLIKFDQLYKVVFPGHERFTINEMGCGYGAFVDYLEAKDVQAEYRGYEISAPMLAAAEEYLCRKEYKTTYELFLNQRMEPADYTIASGIFNANMDGNDGTVEKGEWEAYILEVLGEMHESSRIGFSFNMQTIYSEYFTQYYYGDPCFYFDYCKKNFSRHITLYHDYGLYDFTIVVRNVVSLDEV